MLPPPDPAAQLVQLADAEAVRVQHHHDRRVRDVDADLDDGRRDQHVELPAGEGLHHRVLVLGGHPAVEHLDPQALQRPVHQLLVHVEHRDGGPPPVRGRLGVVAADARAHHERLPPGGDVLAHPLPGPADPGRLLGQGDHGAADRCAALRQLDQRGDLEVAVDGHRDGARDRGRRHDQHVRNGRPLRPQRVALLDPEPVLLVDDHQPEVGEGDALREQGVGADDDPRRAVGRLGQRGTARRRAERAGQQREPGRDVRSPELAGRGERAEHGAQRAGVLLGQHLGGGEQRGLTAAVDHLQHRAQGDDGLAGAHLALEQAVHRRAAAELARQLASDVLLTPGQGEGQGGVERLEQPATSDLPRRAGQRPGHRAALGQHDLQHEGLVPLEPLPGPRHLAHGGGAVDHLQRLLDVDQAVAGAQLVGQRVGAEVDHVQGQPDAALHGHARHLGRGRVDRHERAGELLGHDAVVVVDQLEVRVAQLHAVVEALRLAREVRPATGLEGLVDPRLVEDRQGHAGALGVADHHIGLPQPLADQAVPDGLHLGEDRGVLPDHEVQERRQRPPLDVAPGVVAQQVADGVQVQVGAQRLGGRAADHGRQLAVQRHHDAYSTPSSRG